MLKKELTTLAGEKDLSPIVCLEARFIIENNLLPLLKNAGEKISYIKVNFSSPTYYSILAFPGSNTSDIKRYRTTLPPNTPVVNIWVAVIQLASEYMLKVDALDECIKELTLTMVR